MRLTNLAVAILVLLGTRWGQQALQLGRCAPALKAEPMDVPAVAHVAYTLPSNPPQSDAFMDGFRSECAILGMSWVDDKGCRYYKYSCRDKSRKLMTLDSDGSKQCILFKGEK